MKTPITLERVMKLSGSGFGFSADPSISNKEILSFFEDVTSIINLLDPELNYEGEIYSRRNSTFLHPFRYSKVDSSLQLRSGDPEEFSIDRIIRTYNIRYQRNPPVFKDIEELSKNNPYKHIIEFKPNFNLRTTRPIFSIQEFIDRVSGVDYIKLKEGFGGVFDPMGLARSYEKATEQANVLEGNSIPN